MSTPRYHQAIASARDIALVLSLAQQRELLDILEDYAREIERMVARGIQSRTAGAVLREISALIDAMTNELAGSVGDGVRLTARQMAEIQAAATAELMAGSGLAVGATFSGTGARAAQAILSRPELAEAFVTIRRQSAAAANRIVRRGILRGAPPQSIARELRQYISMPGSLLEGDASILADRRSIGYRVVEELGYDPTPENLALVRSEASQIASRASRIARTEIMQAEAEAHRQGAEESPVVAFIQWRLSYRHREPCACEPIAREDLYGHGSGRYDPRNVPARPHPHCFCVHVDVLRPPEEWGAERRPVPQLVVNPEEVAEQAGYSPSIQASFMSAVQTGQQRETLQTVRA